MGLNVNYIDNATAEIAAGRNANNNGMGNIRLMQTVYPGCTALANGSTQAEAFGYAYALNGASAAKWALTEAEGLGAPKHGPLAWAAISAAIAYKALN